MKLRRIILFYFVCLVGVVSAFAANGHEIRFIYCSDLHYGIKRQFRGEKVDAYKVIGEMVKSFYLLNKTDLPPDGGVGEGTEFGEPDFVVCTGDISNRMHDGVWQACRSWRQFEKDWIETLGCPIYLVPGNHDISNAIGYPKALTPAKDETSAIEIYNHNMPEFGSQKISSFDYTANKVHYTFIKDNLRFAFVGIWPDGFMRCWLDSIFKDDPATSTILFAHDPVEADAKHFTNPNFPYDINSKDKFENLLGDTCSVNAIDMRPVGNWNRLESFFKSHPQIKAYFHGDCNYNEFYDWKGTEGSISLPVFRVDSPMKGELSADDESLLSYQVVCIDTESRVITVRECLWNKNGKTSVNWGKMRSISY